MAIEVVLYKKEDVSEEITLVDIENRSDYDMIKKNLFCAFEGCTAKIEYVPKGKRIAHFKTWPMSDHSSDCIDFFEREQKNRGRKNLASSSMGLTDKHINNVLRSLINSVDETEEEKELRLQKQREKRKKKNQTVDKNKDSDRSEDIRPTTVKDADETLEGKRAPSVKRRHSISFLSEEDLGTAIALHENIASISIEEKRVVILLRKNTKETKVYFEEAFFAKSATNISAMFEVVKRSFDNGDVLALDCVGTVETRGGELSLVIGGQSHIRINKKTIQNFVFGS
ncbi:hypothetical protein JOY40_01055 [Bacillus tropicus]|uniref:hypothetical protein n=1 Tax=Bacillus TaxID=1386 RepID=UPI001F5A274E|nr:MULTISPECIES: hypothetical protein [Bacillus]MCU5471359.1 hypothetical protein [Bacillus paranthracis]MDA1549641.1 hypothetical protein [Bacillus cereus group sp. TH243-3LC]MDA1644985.1 hypothetical protein [Bacillus cereus group sp. TH163-1LC]MDA1793421.1 hypothetical protein [Bacillus cereus group sp. BY8-1LC]MDV5066713.1 hypothetical protein [Bacillus sp. W1]